MIDLIIRPPRLYLLCLSSASFAQLFEPCLLVDHPTKRLVYLYILIVNTLSLSLSLSFFLSHSHTSKMSKRTACVMLGAGVIGADAVQRENFLRKKELTPCCPQFLSWCPRSRTHTPMSLFLPYLLQIPCSITISLSQILPKFYVQTTDSKIE